MELDVSFAGRTTELALGETLRFGRGSQVVEVDLKISDDREVHSCAGSITAKTDGWVLANLGSYLVLRLVERPAGGTIEVPPGRTVLCPWPSAGVEVTWRTDDGPRQVAIEVTSENSHRVPFETGVDGGTVRYSGINRKRTYYRVLVELCRRRIEDPSNRTVPEAKEIARQLNMTARAVEKHIEYLRLKYDLGPDRTYFNSQLGSEIRGSQSQLIEIAILTGDVGPNDLLENSLANFLRED